MKCFRDTVTLFCPGEDGSVSEFLLHKVKFSLKESSFGREGAMFVSLRRSRAYSGEESVPIPRIYTGCTVAFGDVRGICAFPAAVVTGCEVFTSPTGRGDHIKVTLG